MRGLVALGLVAAVVRAALDGDRGAAGPGCVEPADTSANSGTAARAVAVNEGGGHNMPRPILQMRNRGCLIEYGQPVQHDVASANPAGGEARRRVEASSTWTTRALSLSTYTAKGLSTCVRGLERGKGGGLEAVRRQDHESRQPRGVSPTRPWRRFRTRGRSSVSTSSTTQARATTSTYGSSRRAHPPSSRSCRRARRSPTTRSNCMSR